MIEIANVKIPRHLHRVSLSSSRSYSRRPGADQTHRLRRKVRVRRQLSLQLDPCQAERLVALCFAPRAQRFDRENSSCAALACSKRLLDHREKGHRQSPATRGSAGRAKRLCSRQARHLTVALCLATIPEKFV